MAKSNKTPLEPLGKKRLAGKEKLELLVEIAHAYYEQNYDQEIIARSFGISRSQVSRNLKQAKELNLVQVRVIAPDERIEKIEKALMQKFPDLKEAIVVSVFNLSAEPLRKTIARACAYYLDQIIRPGLSICVGSGRTLCEVFNWLHPRKISNVTIVQAMGNVGHEAMDIDFNVMAMAAANAFSANVNLLNAPAILGSGTVSELIEANPSIRKALRIAQTADIYLFGIGSISSDLIFTRSGIFEQEDVEHLRQDGSIGDICARFFDINGREVTSSFRERIVGISLANLRSGALTIGVAGGPDKVLPLIGALHGNLIKVLITDELTAKGILDYAKELI